MIYWCPKCHEQDTAGVTHCASCGEPLLELEVAPMKHDVEPLSRVLPSAEDSPFDCGSEGNRVVESAPSLIAHTNDSSAANIEYSESTFDELWNKLSRAFSYVFVILMAILLALFIYHFASDESLNELRNLYQKNNGSAGNQLPGPGYGTPS